MNEQKIPTTTPSVRAARASGAPGARATVTDVSSALLRIRDIPSFPFDGRRYDVRTWPVYSSDARRVGSVASILIDVRTHDIRYLGVALSDIGTRTSGGTVLVPIGAAFRQGDQRAITLPSLSSAQLAAAPRQADRPVTRDDESTTLSAYGLMELSSRGEPDRYASPYFSEHHLYGLLEGD